MFRLLSSGHIREQRRSRGGDGYVYEYKPWHRTKKASLRISVPCRAALNFRLSAENFFDGIAKDLGIAREIQTGDFGFDRAIYISSDTPEATAAFLKDHDVRRSIRIIFEAHVPELAYDGRQLTAHWPKIDEMAAPPVEDEQRIGEELNRLRECLPRHAPLNAAAPLIGGKVRRVSAAVFTAASLAAVFLLWLSAAAAYPPLDDRAVFLYSLGYGLPLFLFLSAALVIFLSGRSSSHRELAVLLPLCLLASVMLGYGWVVRQNGVEDASLPQSRTVAVIHKYTTRHKGSTKYYAIVRSWRPGKSDECFRISSEQYYRIQPGSSTATITTRAGAYGFEWLVSKKF
jgi:hypothetical protein